MKVCRLEFIVAALIAVLVAGSVRAADLDLPPSAFFGSYEGQSISDPDQGLSKRDLAVRIANAGHGAFVVEWTTITRHADGTPNKKSYAITFMPTPREGIYGSAMRTDKFGASVPLDPLKGEPFVWARIKGRTLTVFALLITHSGGYEMQTYERTLTKTGLHLDFLRLRDGKPLRTITGTLVRVSK